MSESHQPDTGEFLTQGEMNQPTVKILGHNESFDIDISRPLDDDPDALGIDGARAVSTITAGGKQFTIIDTRQSPGSNRDFVVADETMNLQRGVGYKGIKAGDRLHFGKKHTDRFSYPLTVSGNHFDIEYDGAKLQVHNLQPLNATIVTAHEVTKARQAPRVLRYAMEDHRTQTARRRIESHPSYGEIDADAPYGYYMNYPIIGRDSASVNGGVYLGGGSREAIVVDGNSKLLKIAYAEFVSDIKRYGEAAKTIDTTKVLEGVMNTVKQRMSYDKFASSELARFYDNDKVIGLSAYLEAGVGVCRQQGLMAAYMLGRLVEDGYLAGTVGVERNTVAELGGTHAWAIFKNDIGGRKVATIVDPAQSFVGTKDRATRENRWQYDLSTDEY